MASPATVLANIATALGALLSGGSRLSSDLSDVLDRIPAGGLRWQLKSNVSAPQPRSNGTVTTIAVEVVVLYRLGASEAERTYTEGARLSHMQSLLDPAWWQGGPNGSPAGITGVAGFPEQAQAKPALALSDFERPGDGDVITYRITAAVLCAA